MRGKPGRWLDATERAEMLNPRRRIMPVPRLSTPGWSSTSRLITRSLVIERLHRHLDELAEALAQRNDRVDVGLGIDAEIDQERTFRPLRLVERLRDVVERADLHRRDAVGRAKLHEIGHHGQVDLRPDTAVEVVL